ncbi:MAG: Uma2 family endonuclease [Saprospiraceae bacterium]
MKAHKIPKLTVKEYITQEQESNTKYEYHDGEIFALAGGSLNHGLLCGNIYAELRGKLKSKKSSCKPYTSEIKLNIKDRKSYVYPDSMVICGALETSELDENSVTNPTLIVEVLSKSTANYDRGDKFFLYKQIPSLQEYILIEQDRPQVDVFYKKPGTDLWSISRFEGLENKIKLQSIKIEISMAELYFDIKFK